MHCAGVAQARASAPAGGHLSVAAAANHLRQNESEAAAHEAVDDEVDARVERQQEIAGDVDVQQAVARERHVTWHVVVQCDPCSQREVEQIYAQRTMSGRSQENNETYQDLKIKFRSRRKSYKKLRRS